MKELIKITEKNGKKAVSARELHQFLESKQEFANWIKKRIKDYGFIENQDFEVFDNFIKNPEGGRPLKEYAITLDMAKELSMVERNEKGKQARLYFIEMERRALQSENYSLDYDMEQPAIDLSHSRFFVQSIGNYSIRYLMYQSEKWYFIKDFNQIIRTHTDPKSSARTIYRKKHRIRRFLMPGQNFPGWFTDLKGLNNMICRSKRLKQREDRGDFLEFLKDNPQNISIENPQKPPELEVGADKEKQEGLLQILEQTSQNLMALNKNILQLIQIFNQ